MHQFIGAIISTATTLKLLQCCPSGDDALAFRHGFKNWVYTAPYLTMCVWYTAPQIHYYRIDLQYPGGVEEFFNIEVQKVNYALYSLFDLTGSPMQWQHIWLSMLSDKHLQESFRYREFCMEQIIAPVPVLVLPQL